MTPGSIHEKSQLLKKILLAVTRTTAHLATVHSLTDKSSRFSEKRLSNKKFLIKKNFAAAGTRTAAPGHDGQMVRETK